jgi:DNA (cytosine-5)-methyltransferase 1
MSDDSRPLAGPGASPAAHANGGGDDHAVRRKIERLLAGAPLRVLDLFSGCGGMSLGFHHEGCLIVGNVEMDPDAARSHALNFHGADPSSLALHGKARDITATEPEDLAAELGLGPVADVVDVIVGGPPCQAYTRVGRAKLAHLGDDPDAFRSDPRRTLYQRYLHYVRAFRPVALLMENVPDILNQQGDNVVERIASTLGELGYDVRYTLLNAAFHGVPQARERLFMLAYRHELGARIRFPRATHHFKLPPGYASSRAHALKGVLDGRGAHYVEADHGGPHLPRSVSAEEAIGDLPAVRGDAVRRGPRRFDGRSLLPYPEDVPISAYARLMREWPGFEAGAGIVDHAIRHLPRDGWTFARMLEGAEYPDAHAIATRRFEALAKRRKLHPRSNEHAALKAAIIPPYDPGKFPNKWWKLRREAPVRTLMAHLSKDGYSHIHYDPDQARTISVREAARLQSFPDGWRFSGTMNPAFRQIGNAVPPLVAAAIARTMRETLAEALGAAGHAVPLAA